MPSNKDNLDDINLGTPDLSDYDEIIVDICGNVDSGKSSLCGILAHPRINELMYDSYNKAPRDTNDLEDILDDGNGLSRARVLCMDHEKESGRTSSITYNYMKFDDGKSRPRIVSLVDLAGHEQYLKTTITGVVSSYPDHGLVLISKNITHMTREHYAMLASMGIPILFVLTKIDILPKEVVDANIDKIKIMGRRFRRDVVPVDSIDSMHSCINNDKQFGYIKVSNKTGEGLPLLISYIQHINRNKNKNIVNGFAISHIYPNITGFGMVVSGMNGTGITKGDSMIMGPFGKTNEFIPVKIRSIHNDYRQFVDTLEAGVRGCLCVKFDHKYKQHLRMGMVVAHDITQVNVVKKFEADVVIFRGKSSNIKVGYNTYINIGSVRGAVNVTRIRDIETGEDIDMLNNVAKAHMDLEFMYAAKCININDRFLFRAGRVCGIGKVTGFAQLN